MLCRVVDGHWALEKWELLKIQWKLHIFNNDGSKRDKWDPRQKLSFSGKANSASRC